MCKYHGVEHVIDVILLFLQIHQSRHGRIRLAKEFDVRRAATGCHASVHNAWYVGPVAPSRHSQLAELSIAGRIYSRRRTLFRLGSTQLAVRLHRNGICESRDQEFCQELVKFVKTRGTSFTAKLCFVRQKGRIKKTTT